MTVAVYTCECNSVGGGFINTGVWYTSLNESKTRVRCTNVFGGLVVFILPHYNTSGPTGHWAEEWSLCVLKALSSWFLPYGIIYPNRSYGQELPIWDNPLSIILSTENGQHKNSLQWHSPFLISFFSLIQFFPKLQLNDNYIKNFSLCIPLLLLTVLCRAIRQLAGAGASILCPACSRSLTPPLFRRQKMEQISSCFLLEFLFQVHAQNAVD